MTSSFTKLISKLPPAFTNQFRNGNFEFAIAGSLFAYLGYSVFENNQRLEQMKRTQQMMDSESSKALRDELRSKYLNTLEEEHRVKQETLDKYRSSKSLFQCEVMISLPLDGQMGLQNVALGDILDVIEEGVGPKNEYSLCRFITEGDGSDLTPGQIGWYPTRCLREKENQEGSFWWRRFFR